MARGNAGGAPPSDVSEPVAPMPFSWQEPGSVSCLDASLWPGPSREFHRLGAPPGGIPVRARARVHVHATREASEAPPARSLRPTRRERHRRGGGGGRAYAATSPMTFTLRTRTTKLTVSSHPDAGDEAVKVALTAEAAAAERERRGASRGATSGDGSERAAYRRPWVSAQGTAPKASKLHPK
ncbi:unnamed protein product [Lampetra fluviatilis]